MAKKGILDCLNVNNMLFGNRKHWLCHVRNAILCKITLRITTNTV